MPDSSHLSAPELEDAKRRAAQAQQQRAEFRHRIDAFEQESDSPSSPHNAPSRTLEDLRREPMMAHLLDALEKGKDIGHYGRLVFAMVAHHFMPEDELLSWLRKDRDFTGEAALALVRQVQTRDYNPPRRDRILAWQKEQDFPILPNPEDPDCGNVYRNLKFPDAVYEHIEEYQQEKATAAHLEQP